MSSNFSELLYIPAERKHDSNPLLNAVDGGITQFSRSMLKQDNVYRPTMKSIYLYLKLQ